MYRNKITGNDIWLEEMSNYYFGHDQMFVDSPIVFPTVSFYICDTHNFNSAIDDMRIKAGYKPMFRGDYGEYDDEGWYDYTIRVSLIDEEVRVDNCIEAIVCNSESDDEEQTYNIDLTETEKVDVLKKLNEECIKYFDMTCKELLMEAKKEMVD